MSIIDNEQDEGDIFEPTSFQGLRTPEQANAALRHFSNLASRYHTQLMQRNLTTAQIDNTMSTLWGRIIKACKQHSIPLNPTAEAWDKRLGGQ